MPFQAIRAAERMNNAKRKAEEADQILALLTFDQWGMKEWKKWKLL